MFSVLDLLERAPTIAITDVGAMSLGDGSDVYDGLLRRGVAKVFGFEPIEAECEKLNQRATPSCRYLPYAIGDGTLKTFHVTNRLVTSSLYPPNTELMAKFQNLENLVRVERRIPVQTHRLDDLPEVAGTDFLKIDVQGAERDVILGATNTLADAVIVQVEVEFVPLYLDQPLFAEVDQAMRANGFMFHKFTRQSSRVFKPVLLNNDVNAQGSQLLWGDAVYVKDLTRLDSVSSEKLLKLAIVLHDVYGSVDASAFVLQERDKVAHDGLLHRYYDYLVRAVNGATP
jgi:FkbM family methyltransferase